MMQGVMCRPQGATFTPAQACKSLQMTMYLPLGFSFLHIFIVCTPGYTGHSTSERLENFREGIGSLFPPCGLYGIEVRSEGLVTNILASHLTCPSLFFLTNYERE